MLVFGEGGKPEYPEKNLSEQGREPTNSAHKRHRGRGERGKPKYRRKTSRSKEENQQTQPTSDTEGEGRGENRSTGEKPLGARKRTNKLSPQATPRERGEGKTEVPEKNLSEQGREPTNSAHKWHRIGESNLGHIGGRRVLSSLRHPCSPFMNVFVVITYCTLIIINSN